MRMRLLPLLVFSLALMVGRACGEDAGKEDETQPDNTPDVQSTDPRYETTGNPRQIWARSYLFCDAPKIEVNRWLTEKPELEGKFVLIEFWRTWCGACKRTVPLLNGFHEKYGKELVVIGITGEPEEKVKAYNGPEMKYFQALDLAGSKPEGEDEGKEEDEGKRRDKDQGALEEAFEVWGWPHVVLLEPEHHTVIWEGFPLWKGHELTAEKIEKFLAIGRQKKEQK